MIRLSRFLLSILFLLVVVLVALAALTYGEALLLRDWYSVMPLRVDEWVNETWVELFQFWGIWGILVSAAFVLVWLTLGQFMFQVRSYTSAGGRGLWVGLLVGLLIITIVASFFIIPPTQDLGKPFASAFFFLNALFVYWFSSVIFSPSNVKYAPWGASRMAIPANGIIGRVQGARR